MGFPSKENSEQEPCNPFIVIHSDKIRRAKEISWEMFAHKISLKRKEYQDMELNLKLGFIWKYFKAFIELENMNMTNEWKNKLELGIHYQIKKIRLLICIISMKQLIVVKLPQNGSDIPGSP